MAEKRMFSKKITDSDDFISLSSSSQALYFHLNQGADDDGFNNQVQMAMYKSHASLDDLKVLLAKRFLLQFDNGVVVIKHWWINNTLRKDRYTATNFQDELKKLSIKENRSYTLKTDEELWLPDGCHSIDKISKDKNNNIYITHLDLKYVKLTEVQYNKLNKDYPSEDIDNCILLLDEYVTINGNKNKYKDWNLVLRKSIREQWFKKGINTTPKKQGAIPDWYKGYEQELNNPKGQASKEIQELAKGLFED